MPESERLQVLRQQRALVQEQLALLDRQIALEARTAAAPVTQAAADSILRSPASARPPVSPRAEAEADALLAQLVASEGDSRAFSKSGCWMIFSLVMVVALALVGVIYYFFYR
jgi:hypothetical protein